VRARGFTLIEVLVALVIVVLGMSALMGALSSSARSVTYMQDKTFAEWVALNQIVTVRLQLQQGQVPPTENTNGDIDFGNRSWHWRQEVVANQIQGMVRIDVKVRPKEVKGGDDDNWYVTVSGIAGNAVGAAVTSAVSVNWDGALGASGTGGANTGTLQNNGTTNTTTNGSTNGLGTGGGTGLGNGTGTGLGNGTGTGLGNGTGTGTTGGSTTTPVQNPGRP
jgi:general secretion pathway protein I